MGRAIFDLVYKQNRYDLYKKTIAIWHFSEEIEQERQNHVLESLLKYFTTSGADIKIYTNTKKEHRPNGYPIQYCDNKYKCLLYSDTLIILGKMPTIETLNKLEISEINKKKLIIDCNSNFSPNAVQK